MTISEIVAELGLSRTTAYEMIRSMVKSDYVERVGNSGRYRLGRRVYQLGMAYRNQVDLLREGNHVIEVLSETTKETAQLSVLDHAKLLVLLKSEGKQSITIVTHIGSRIPINWAASGRLLVSDLSDQELREQLPAMIEPSPTGKATTKIESLITEIRQSRARGYDIQMKQSNPHTGSIAAPVIDESGRCVAAVSIVVPDHRLKRPHQKVLIPAVVDAAAVLSRHLGGS